MRLPEQHPLLALARDVAGQPGRWSACVAAARHTPTIVPNEFLAAAQSSDLLEHWPPLNFLAPALAFSALQALFGRSEQARAIGHWTLRHPLNDPWLMFVRIALCDSLLEYPEATRDHNPFLFGLLQSGRGESYARSPQVNRLRNEQIALECQDLALQVCAENLYGPASEPAGPLREPSLRLFRRLLRPWRFAATESDSDSQNAWGDLQARVQTNAGNLYKERITGVRSANLETATEFYEKALSYWSHKNRWLEVGQVMNNLGAVTLQKALRDLDTLDVLHSSSISFERPFTGGTAAQCIQQSLRWHERALAIFIQSTDENLAETYGHLGNARLAGRHFGVAGSRDEAVGHFRAALEIYRDLQRRDRISMLQNNLGAALIISQDKTSKATLREALGYFEQSASELARLHSHREAIVAFTNAGETQALLEDWPAACEAFAAAAQVVEMEIAGDSTDATRRAWLRRELSVFDGLAAGYVRQVETLKESDERTATHAAEAAWWIERARARSLAEFMVAGKQLPNGISPDHYRKYCLDADRIRDLDHCIEGGERELTAGAHSLDSESIRRRLASAREERSRLMERRECEKQRFSHADPAWAPAAPPMNIEEMQAVAREAGAGLLSLRPTRWGVCAVLIPPSGIVVAKTFRDLTRQSIRDLFARRRTDGTNEGWIADYRRFGVSTNDLPGSPWFDTLLQTLSTLGEKLWLPLRGWLQKHYPSHRSHTTAPPPPLVILASGGLHMLPFHALFWSDRGTRRWADEDYRISYAPSIWILNQCLQRRRMQAACSSSVLAVINPTGHSDYSLGSEAYELEWIQHRFPFATILSHPNQTRFQAATHQRLRTELPRASMLLLSTHARFDFLNPWIKSGFFTADYRFGTEDQPNFTLSDLFQLDLSRLGLVALSACETAMSDFQDPSSEELGLPAAFLAAGAATVIASSWTVYDPSTALLMREFFHELDGASTTPGIALWRAQSTLRALQEDDPKMIALKEQLPAAHRDMARREPSLAVAYDRLPFAHPYFWSAFSCFGAF